MCFACVGFIIGGVVGISIGMAIRKNISRPHFMQAVQCISYQGIEVQIYMQKTFMQKARI